MNGIVFFFLRLKMNKIEIKPNFAQLFDQIKSYCKIIFPMIFINITLWIVLKATFEY